MGGNITLGRGIACVELKGYQACSIFTRAFTQLYLCLSPPHYECSTNYSSARFTLSGHSGKGRGHCDPNSGGRRAAAPRRGLLRLSEPVNYPDPSSLNVETAGAGSKMLVPGFYLFIFGLG